MLNRDVSVRFRLPREFNLLLLPLRYCLAMKLKFPRPAHGLDRKGHAAMAHENQTRSTVLRSLAKDVTANTLAIVAASMIPLIAMVGGGVDASRFYMAEARLQAACDAGALAARRSMDDDDFSKEDEEVGDAFFTQNFSDDMFGMVDLQHEYDATEDGEVVGTASGSMPTTLMGIFGYDDFDLSVDCTADINISNTDIMFVLDVTGSMNCPATDLTCTNNGEVEATDSKIDNLRASVLTFYDTVELATSDKAQVRYGIIPYANQVNVGESLDAAWLASSHTYQSREGVWESGSAGGSTSTSYLRTGNGNNFQYKSVKTRTWYGLSYDQCVAKANNDEYDIYNSSNSNNWTQIAQVGLNPVVTTYTGNVTYEYYKTNWNHPQSYRSSDGRCLLNQDFYLYDAFSTITETVVPAQEVSNFKEWVYRPVTYDVSSVKQNGYLVAPTGWDGADVTHYWNGCVEEASTVATATWDPVDPSAYDLDIDLVPSGEAEKWKPMLPTLVWQRYIDGGNWWAAGWTLDDVNSTENKEQGPIYCPKSARKLAPFDSREDLESWISESNGFVAKGATYHDFGMIWGARFISPDGIFADENSSAPNGDAIARHIVFMTDGTQATSNNVYGLYGLEWWDRRVTSDGTPLQMEDRHASRFQAACKAARNKNISVWVVAFGTTLTQNLIDCATPGRAFSANDADELDDAFREIAQKIAALRLTD